MQRLRLVCCHRCICCSNTCFQRNVGKVPNFLVKAEYCKMNKATVIDLRRLIRQNRPRSIGGVHGFEKRDLVVKPKRSRMAIQLLKNPAYIIIPSTWISWCPFSLEYILAGQQQQLPSLAQFKIHNGRNTAVFDERGYRYSNCIPSTKHSMCTWRCSKKNAGCKAKIKVTHAGFIVAKIHEHNH